VAAGPPLSEQIDRDEIAADWPTFLALLGLTVALTIITVDVATRTTGSGGVWTRPDSSCFHIHTRFAALVVESPGAHPPVFQPCGSAMVQAGTASWARLARIAGHGCAFAQRIRTSDA
jgi:hypothetical protein